MSFTLGKPFKFGTWRLDHGFTHSRPWATDSRIQDRARHQRMDAQDRARRLSVRNGPGRDAQGAK
jgi:hypothetical protein